MLDPAIKLFGKTIPLSDSRLSLLASEISDPPVEQPPQHKDVCRETTKEEIDDSPEEELCKQNTLDCKKSSSKCEEEQVTTNVSGQDKILKKPDKIIPCPRCNSLETKFCYYNNYNVNQPRHFCKNCQRYWTAGGTMRNVPVGAGRRKNKHIASQQYRHIMMSNDGVPTAQTDPATHKVISCGSLSSSTRPLIGNETVLKFCPETPLCESMTSALNLGDQKKQAEIASGVSEESIEKCDQVAENVGKSESPRSVSGSCNGPSPHSLQCYPGQPWVYPWNSGWNGVDPMVASRCSSEMICRPETGNPKQVAWGAAPPLPMVAAPAFCTPTIPFPFVPAAYWGCMQGWTAGTWNVPWVGSTGNLSPSSSTNNSGCSSSGSPTLGKHCRDTNLQGEDKSDKCLWVPKTLRIDDPDEAAKSSIWATLGIKPNQKEPLQKGGIFKAFQSKTGGTGPESDATHIMHSNPAALSRSQAFQEST